MSNLSVQKNEEVNIEGFNSIAKYIRYQKLSQSNDNGLIIKIDDIGASSIAESNKNSDSKKIIVENDKLNSPSNTIKSVINEVEKLGLNALKTDKSLQKFEQMKFLYSTFGESWLVQVFHNIKNTEYQFALIEYALKSGQNPMSLFEINIYWMMTKIKKCQTVKLNGQKIELQKKSEQEGVFYPKFYWQCEFVFKLFCLYSGENLFDLFSAEKIVRLFGSCANQFVEFCYDKKCDNKKNDSDILSNQLKEEFKSKGKRYGIFGGLFGFFVSFMFIFITAHIVTISSAWIFLAIPIGTLAGWASGKIQALREYNKILNLLSQTNKEDNVSLMKQTFKAFKKEYKFSKQNPPFEKQNETNEKLINQPDLEKSINQSKEFNNSGH